MQSLGDHLVEREEKLTSVVHISMLFISVSDSCQSTS